MKDLARKEFDLIVRGGLVWPGPGQKPIESGAVGIRRGLVARIGRWSDFQGAAGPVIGGPGRLVMPGLVNGHTHLAMTMFRGLADDLPLMDWLQDHIWPAEAGFVSEETVYLASLLALAEAVRSGTTCLADAYFCEKGAVRAIARAGLRAVAAQGVIDFPAPGVPDPKDNLAVARDFLMWAGGVSPLIRPALFCHAPYTCGPATLAGAKALADEFETWCFTHLSEAKGENAQVSADRGRRPTAYLDSVGFLDGRTVAVHAVHLRPDEIDLLAERGVGVVTCPESNMKLASGRAEVARWLKAGLKAGLGTDGAASNNDLNLFGEMGSLARWHKAAESDPALLPAKMVLLLATAGGAEALGFEGLGRLAPGGPADMITLDLDEPHLMPLHNLSAQLVYSAHGGEVRDSVVAGRVLMQDGCLLTIDLEEVRAGMAVLSREIRRGR